LTSLEAKRGLLYYWMQELGNVNYKVALNGKFSERDIQIKDMDAGISELADVLDKYGKACLLCACTRKNCHRFTVASEAEKRLGTKVIHI
jgi:hypothetical protein